jgi:hypothetical protein
MGLIMSIFLEHSPASLSHADVWAEPSTGLEWCDCGCHHPLTKTIVREFARDLFGLDLPAQVTHYQVIRICMILWKVIRPCRFFTLSVEDAAIRVNGSIAATYPLNTGLAIVKAFSNHWNGCPTEDCPDDDPDDAGEAA